MKIYWWQLFRILICVGTLGRAGAQITSVNESEITVRFNWQSPTGMPLSTTVNTNIGSNGQLSSTNSSLTGVGIYSTLPVTTNQFGSFLAVGAVVAFTDTNTNFSGKNPLNITYASQAGMPTAGTASGGVIQTMAMIGMPYFGDALSYDFGSVLPAPATDYTGTNYNIPTSYWQTIPVATTNNSFYYSPNAGRVFATQTGNINITWLTSQSWSAGNLPAYQNPGGGASFLTNGASIYLLYTQNYLVLGTPVKTPQNIYWTENSFSATGYPVTIPSGRVTAVNIVYNTSFPQTVSTNNVYVDPDGDNGDGTVITNTLWYAYGSLHAYNVQGLVFMEVLGPQNPATGTHQYLGFEIVNVAMSAGPVTVPISLGNPLTPFADGFENQSLTPTPMGGPLTTASDFYFVNDGGDPNVYWADQPTVDPTDCQVYWLTNGVAGIQWPVFLDAYSLTWPTDATQYSYYLRPNAATSAQAAQTAVTLDEAEVPSLDYFDPLDQPRAFLTSSNTFYTWLTTAEPAQRALLRFTYGANTRYERVFSVLAAGLQNNALLAGSVAFNLSAWNASNSTLTNFPASFAAPYVTNASVVVGQQLTVPPGEIGSTNGTYGDYWAGYVNVNPLDASAGDNSIGTSYDVNAYVDPFANGFTAANQGAILPVNAIPGHNHLEVWWFQQNNANNALGFQSIYWPTVVADYTITWPTNAPAIVLAGDNGSGPLDDEQSQGSIYYQNDPAQPGYNPNEEHAVLLGGQVYALADDLNLTNGTFSTNAAVNAYSSAPFVLLQYTGDDGRPNLSVFAVQRENASASQVFDYVTTAGTLLQAPMPLPLLAPPLVPDAATGGYTNCNQESVASQGDWPAWYSANGSFGQYQNYNLFTFLDRNNDNWVYRGLNAGLPALQAGYYNTNTAAFTNTLPAATAVVNTGFTNYIHVSRFLNTLTIGATNLPPGIAVEEDITNGLFLTGIPTATGFYPVVVTLTDAADLSTVTVNVPVTVTNSGPVVATGPLLLTSINPYTGETNVFSGRPPLVGTSPNPSNSFRIHFYYPTQPGFAWPALGNLTNWPVAGTVVPYLLTNGTPASAATNYLTPSLSVVYRPTWPEAGSDGVTPLPVLQRGQTLTTAINGLTAVRGQDSVQVLYQQAIATNSLLGDTNASVVLYDPTVQKTAPLTNGLPSSVQTDLYQGLQYFPTLPANLISRFWYDPQQQRLVFTGQYVHDVVNGDYVLLNVLRGDDLAAVENLCSSNDSALPYWISAVTNLAVKTSTSFINTNGDYQVNPAWTVTNYAGNLVVITNSDTAVDSYALCAAGPNPGYVVYVTANDRNPNRAGDPVGINIIRVDTNLFTGNLLVVNAANASPFSETITFEHTSDLAGEGTNYLWDWRIIPPNNGLEPTSSETNWPQFAQANPGPVFTLGATGVQGLGDNYVSVRYGFTNAQNQVVWSPFASPILAQGWIKRVTENIDPVAGQTQNLYQNPATTTASLIELAGSRWTGNVPLNSATLTNNGLIQVFETVLNMGKNLSINAGINYGPANQALLLAAGYLNDLYMTLGNDAWANSLNPTISVGTDNSTYGDIATSQFVFEGEEPTLLEQNLALLRGRDDSVSPGVDVPPVYNHLWWNYTYGIAAGEVFYALNYNITDQNGDGVVNAEDAQIMYPQGHGDAYGHYLTALTDYYQLLLNPNFDWVPQTTAVSILGATVQVNYQDEQKFAATAAAEARTGEQIFQLTWREDYRPGTSGGWSYFASNYVGQYTYVDNQGHTDPITRYWGLDHWAARVGQGTYVNWVVGNGMLPPKDTNPNDQGIEIIDRTTVQDLQELPATATALQQDLDNANAGFTPMGLAQNAIPFDINPAQVTGANPQTHFEQIYNRAVQALNNAATAFNAAQTVTADLRQQQNSLNDLVAADTQQEAAYNEQLIELYGTPYPDDIGPTGTYPQGYSGPDLLHYGYVDNVATNTFGGQSKDPYTNYTFEVDIQGLPSNWTNDLNSGLPGTISTVAASSSSYNGNDYISFNVGPDPFNEPPGWTTERGVVGSIQTAAMAVNAANDAYRSSLSGAVGAKKALDAAISLFQSQADYGIGETTAQNAIVAATAAGQWAQYNYNSANALFTAILGAKDAASSLLTFLPNTVIAGLADGGDQLKALELPDKEALGILTAQTLNQQFLASIANSGLQVLSQQTINALNIGINSAKQAQAIQSSMAALQTQYSALSATYSTINQAAQALNGAWANYNNLVAQGNRIQQQRLSFRQHEAALVQGYTVANSAFLVFQNEDLERYNSLFNLAAEYAYMAANAYDYETGLLGTPAGQTYLNQIISSCALGVVQNGQPQISGTTTGDPGLANALAEMYGDYEVLKGRLGFNNPDGYGTIVSLRQENYRINTDSTGDNNWQQVLENGLMADLRADPDVAEHCLQIDDGSGQAVPGIELTFSTTVTSGENLFGQPLGPADHAFSDSSFATKIFSVGVDLDGYVGMDNPVANSGAQGYSPADPNLPDALSATPYVYLIPCGADSMRSPPLGDTSTVRTWNVDDVAIPLPYNIGASDFADNPQYVSSDSLSEPLFAIRKQQAFRPVSTPDAFQTSIYGVDGSLQPSQYTNERLIGRSVWNSKWKLIIPGKTLLADPNQGLAEFIKTVKDIHLYFVTYSYSGN